MWWFQTGQPAAPTPTTQAKRADLLAEGYPARVVGGGSSLGKGNKYWLRGEISGSLELPLEGLSVDSLSISFDSLERTFALNVGVAYALDDWLTVNGTAVASKETLGGGCVGWEIGVDVHMDTRFATVDLQGQAEYR